MPVNLGALPANAGFKKQTQYLQQGIPYVPGATTQPYYLPTDLPLESIFFRIHGTPAVTTVTTAATLNAPWATDAFGNRCVPALANALGTVTMTGKPQDGSDGINVNNIPAALLALDSYLMTGTVPSSDVDFSVSSPATACSSTVTLHFADLRLSDDTYFLTALEAMRYGDDKALSVALKMGELNDATLNPDYSVSVGGTYVGLTAGTLKIDIGYTQLVPTNFTWPEYAVDDNGNAVSGMPTFDRDFEYDANLGITQAQSNNLNLSRRRLQANTLFIETQVASSGVEQGVNGLGISPNTYLEQKLGGNSLDKLDPFQMIEFAQNNQMFGHSGIPTGVYSYDDWNDSLANAVSLITAKGSHTWNTNAGPNSLSLNERILHITYNPSARAQFVAWNGGKGERI